MTAFEKWWREYARTDGAARVESCRAAWEAGVRAGIQELLAMQETSNNWCRDAARALRSLMANPEEPR